jgi:hypothetical protein
MDDADPKAFFGEKSICKWFNPENVTHVRAYKHLQVEGQWPLGFIPDDTHFPVNWQIFIAGRMADLYMNWKLSIDDYVRSVE